MLIRDPQNATLVSPAQAESAARLMCPSMSPAAMLSARVIGGRSGAGASRSPQAARVATAANIKIIVFLLLMNYES